MTRPEWRPDDVAAWLAGRGPLLIVGAEGLEPEATALVAASSAAELAQDPGAALAKLRPALERIAQAPAPPAATALAALLRAHPEAGAVALSAGGGLARAGAHPLVELVGALTRARCLACAHGPLGLDETCPACGGRARPDAVLADEVLDPRRRLEAEYLAARAERVLVVGAREPTPSLRNVLRSPVEEEAEIVWVGEREQPGDGPWLAGAPDERVPELVEAFLAL